MVEVIMPDGTEFTVNQDTVSHDVVELTREGWHAALEDMAEERGYCQKLGSEHTALFTDRGSTLLVTFETTTRIMEADGDGLPYGWSLADKYGWSQLCILADERTWFRDHHVIGYFDRLVDEAYFEDFDRVVFFGAGDCGYGAAAFSVTAPGSTVVLLQPQATLDARDVPWDDRYRNDRRRFLGDRYAYAPDMVDAAEQVFVLYDPEQDLDASHAALFRRPHVTRLPLRFVGQRVDLAMAQMNLLDPTLQAAADGTLSAQSFWKMYRPKRRDYLPVMRQYLHRLIETEKNRAIVLLARHVIRSHNAPRFRRAGDAAVRNLAKSGVTMELVPAETDTPVS